MTDRCAHGVKGGEHGECHACKREAWQQCIQGAERAVINAAEALVDWAGTPASAGLAERTLKLTVAVYILREAREAAK